MSSEVNDLAAIDVSAGNAHGWHQVEGVAAGADHELRRTHAAAIDGLERMDVARDNHAHARRHV